MNGASLLIYWHAAQQDAADALEAARSFQAEARTRNPGLQARLYRRRDGDGVRVTLMETYSCEAGLPDGLASDAAQALGRWALAGRHVEAFEPAD